MTIGEMEEEEMKTDYKNNTSYHAFDLANPDQDHTVRAMLSDMNKTIIKLKGSLSEIRKAISGSEETNDINELNDYCMIETVIRLREEIASCLETSEKIREFLW